MVLAKRDFFFFLEKLLRYLKTCCALDSRGYHRLKLLRKAILGYLGLVHLVLQQVDLKMEDWSSSI